MRKIAVVLAIVVILIVGGFATLEWLKTADDSDNRLLCEIREDLGYRNGEPTCFELFG